MKKFFGWLKKIFVKNHEKDVIFHNDFAFWLFLGIVLLIPLASIFISLLYYFYEEGVIDENVFILPLIKKLCNMLSVLESNDYFLTNLGVVLQVVCAIVCSGISILNISLSLLNNDFLGIKIKSIFEMRKRYSFSVKWSTIILIALLIISSIGYVTDRIYLCITIAAVSLVFSCYLLFTEFPYLMLKNKAIFKLVDDRFIDEYNGKAKQNDYIANDFSKLVFALINDAGKGLSWVYGKLKHKNKDLYNRFLLYRLLEIQTDNAFEIEQIESKKELLRTTDKLLESVCDIISGSFDITKILGSNINEYKHYVTRVLFQLLSNETSGKKAEAYLADWISWNMYYGENNEINEDLCFSVLTSIIIEQIKNDKFSLIQSVKKSLSIHDFELQKNNITSRSFLMISFIMYYLSEVEDTVPNQIKQGINNIVQQSNIEDNTEVLSWKLLFEHFAFYFPVPLDVFVKDFCQNEQQYAFYLDSNHANTVVLTDELAIKWYLANFFNSRASFVDIDYNSLFSNTRKYYLKTLEKEIFNQDSGEFQPSEQLVKFASFYSDTTEYLDLFGTIENQKNSLKKYIQSLRREELERQIDESTQISNNELASQYLNQIKEKIQGLFGFDPSLEINSDNTVCVSYLGEIKSEAINHNEFIVDAMFRELVQDIRKKGIKPYQKTIQIGDDFENRIDDLANNKFEYVTSDIQYLEKRITNRAIAQKLANKIHCANEIEAHNWFFPMPTVLLFDAFKFNCNVKFTVDNLSPGQISQYAEKFKRQDGKYVYKDTYLTREELSRIIMNTIVLYKAEFSYYVKTYEDGICILDMYPELHNKK